MIRFVSVRATQAAITLLAVSFIVFVLGRLSGDPTTRLLPFEASRADREALRQELGLDKPLAHQYAIYLGDLVTGDAGTSLRAGRPVWEVTKPALINSLKLATVAMAIAIVVGISSGVVGARYRRHLAGRSAMVLALLGQSLPSFWVGIALILLFAVNLDILPASGTGGWEHYVLPGVTLGWFVAASVARLLRSELIDIEDSEFVKFARASGLKQRSIVWKHMLKNALSPVATFVGFSYGMVLATAITTEVVFSWPGVGQLVYQAVIWRDFPLLQFLVLLFAVFMILGNFLADLAYSVLDPRVRL